MIAHKLHDLPRQFLRFFRAVAHAQRVHHIGQPHDAQADAAHPMRRFLELRHGRHIGVGLHDIVEKMGGCRHRLLPASPNRFRLPR